MKRNLGNVDISVRFVLALTLYYFAVNLHISTAVKVTIFTISAYLLVTSFINVCLIYSLFKIDTYGHNKRDKHNRTQKFI